jgi:NAD+ synthase (glutamine-hydrolysing)
MSISGLVRVTAVSPVVTVGDPAANVQAILAACEEHSASQVLLFPELCLTGYTCGDLFAQTALLDQAVASLLQLLKATRHNSTLIVVGLPLSVGGKLYNVAACLQSGEILGILPKQYLPNYQEFYEARWFQAADGSEPAEVYIEGYGSTHFGVDWLLEAQGVVIGIEICEDLWMPIPPSSLQALAGANVLLNLSASNETIGKAEWRRHLVASQSGRCLAAYIYCSAGPSESTTDIVFGGHSLIAECGTVLAESSRVGDGGMLPLAGGFVTADIDFERIDHDRRVQGTFHQSRTDVLQPKKRIPVQLKPHPNDVKRTVNAHPFVPKDPRILKARCEEVFGIQCAALAKRLQQLPSHLPLQIGVSGGLDSTLALLVACKTLQHLGQSPKRIVGWTLPGFGTTDRTLENSKQLMKLLGITPRAQDIRELSLSTFTALGHKPFGLDLSGCTVAEVQSKLQQLPEKDRHDLVFENVQARLRTLLLMSGGFVLGTGDLSESALGWSTYNGDHMSMYNVNASIPKTLVRFLIDFVAENQFTGEIRDVLRSVSTTPISPELLPPSSQGEIQQSTEAVLGPYELHDFFLYCMIRNGYSPQKIVALAENATFSRIYAQKEIIESLKTFYRRFFQNQFKRSCVPDGPKVGSVSLSPRGDWRMPSDASVRAWLDQLPT